jgi:hypothetical protein
VRFCRHLIAVVLAAAVIVGLGMLWAHACGGSTGSGSGLRRAPSCAALLRLEQVKASVIRVHSGSGFHLADTGDLIRTCVIEAVLATVVITVSAVRRRHRRGRRPPQAGFPQLAAHRPGLEGPSGPGHAGLAGVTIRGHISSLPVPSRPRRPSEGEAR